MTARYDWTINQGETTRLVYSRVDASSTPIPFQSSNPVFKMQARQKYGGSVVLELSTAGYQQGSGTVEFNVDPLSAGNDAGKSKVEIYISSTKTAAVTAPGKYVYDIETVMPNGDRERFLEGTLIVTPEVTV